MVVHNVIRPILGDDVADRMRGNIVASLEAEFDPHRFWANRAGAAGLFDLVMGHKRQQLAEQARSSFSATDDKLPRASCDQVCSVMAQRCHDLLAKLKAGSNMEPVEKEETSPPEKDVKQSTDGEDDEQDDQGTGKADEGNDDEHDEEDDEAAFTPAQRRIFTDKQIRIPAAMAQQLEQAVSPGRPALPRKPGCLLPRLPFVPEKWDDNDLLSFAAATCTRVNEWCDTQRRCPRPPPTSLAANTTSRTAG